MRLYVSVLVLFLQFNICSAWAGNNTLVPNLAAWQYADSVLQKLSPPEQVSQLLVIYAQSEWNVPSMEKLKTDVKTYQPGGIIVFRGNEQSATRMITTLQKLSAIPLLVSIDGETGLTMKMTQEQGIPWAMVCGAVRDSRLIEEAGVAVGTQFAKMGIHINYAPVVDLNSNPLNPIINFRSFGEMPENVVNKSASFIAGLQSQNVMGVIKHFPGHGDTKVDSHHALPVVEKTDEELQKYEYYPFKQLIARGAQGVMVAHLLVSQIDSVLPASLSPTFLTNILRKEWNFEGLIFTDAMNMSALNKYKQNKHLQALTAGADVLVMPQNCATAYNELVAALNSGELSKALVAEKCRKVLAYKYMLIIDKNRKVNQSAQNVGNNLASVSSKIAQASITLARNTNQLLPLTFENCRDIAFVYCGTSLSAFKDRVADYGRFDSYVCTSAESVKALMPSLVGYKKIVVVAHGALLNSENNYGVNGRIIAQLNTLASENMQLVLVLLANPYALNGVECTGLNNFAAVIFGYTTQYKMPDYMAQAIFGGISISGMLPVSVAGCFKAGEGLYTQKSRLGFSTPESEKMKEDLNTKIDSLAWNAIGKRAAPGMQVVVVKNGNVVHHKGYGTLSYDDKTAVTTQTLFDLASLTKIVATTPIAMKLVEQNRMDINDKISKYLPELAFTNKANITIEQLLTHTAGLVPYIPFYRNLYNPTSVNKKSLTYHRPTAPYNLKIDQNVYFNQNAKFFDSHVKNSPDTVFSLQLANNIYLHKSFRDSVYAMMDSSKIYPKVGYKYSDLSMIYLQRVIEKIAGASIDRLVQSYFYNSLGAWSAQFLPLKTVAKNEIAPTENDIWFRKQLLQGFVHDQSAAVLGNVAGNAGLFGNAIDLAKMMQMLLNGGNYGNQSYLDAKTIQYFTQYKHVTCRRALGFDKFDKANPTAAIACNRVSELSYGHSGFTGTFVWSDPKYNLIYIFLSNRIYPTISEKALFTLGLRPKIHEVIYQSLVE